MDRVATVVAGRRSKYAVLAAWVLLIMAAAPFAGKLFDVVEDSFASFLPSSAESLAVLEAQQAIPGGETSAVAVVYRRTGGITEDDQALAVTHADELRERYAPAESELAIVPSADGEALLYQVPVSTAGAQDVGDVLIEAVREVREAVHAGTRAEPRVSNGLEVLVTGPGATTADRAESFGGLEGTLVLVPVIVVAVLLLLIYRSPVLFLVPLISVVIAYQVSSTLLYGLVEGFGLTVNSLGAGVLGILTYALGIDYALLLIARYRHELRRHTDRHKAMRNALARSGPAMVASAGTVAVGLLCLLLASVSSTRALGPIGFLAAFGAFAAITTLLPVLLLLLGRWVFWPAVPRADAELYVPSGVWPRVASAVSARPRGVWVATSVAIAVCAIGVIGFSSPQQTTFRSEPESMTGQAVLADHYAAGTSSPVDIIAPADRTADVTAAASAVPGVLDVEPATETDDVVYLQATMQAEPDSEGARTTIEALRAEIGPLEAQVGGPSAINLDMTTANIADAQIVIPVVLITVLLILCVLLRALVAPILMIATVVLSFGAALGLSVALFENVLGWHGQDASLPLLAFVFLVALGVDYNIFLMSRIREEALVAGTRAGTVRGLVLTGGVITSAGVVLAATFAVLVVLPVLSLAQLGFVVAIGILLDTLIVRSLLVPALTLDIGPAIWWPGRLARTAVEQPRSAEASLTPTTRR